MALSLAAEHFVPVVDPAVAAALFKSAVSNVELAISSYCNRRCHYCPNAYVDRVSKNIFMDDGVFFTILRQLKSVDYSGAIALHRYNEPLADRDYAIMRINGIRSFLPNAIIKIFTNGDYLDRDYVAALADAGVNEMWVTIHKSQPTTSLESRYALARKRLDAIGMPYEEVGDRTSYLGTYAILRHGGMVAMFFVRDFDKRDDEGVLIGMQDRGSSLQVEAQFLRREPCFSPFTEMQIEYDGTLYPCCHIHSDIGEHKRYVLGKISEGSDLFLAYASLAYVRWRRGLFSFEPKTGPCANCTYFADNVRRALDPGAVEQLRRTFGLLD